MKALLILVGGRPIPNILTVLHEKPDNIVAICSEESIKEEWLQMEPAISSLLPSSHLQVMEAIDAFDCYAVKRACENAFSLYPYADWIFNATVATSLMTLGVFMAAEECKKKDGASIQCWYLDTAHSRVISLVGEKREADIFFIDVNQYAIAYNYRLQDASNCKSYRSRYMQEDWMAFARRLGKSLYEMTLLKHILKEYSSSKAKKVVKTNEVYSFLQELEKIALVRNLREEELHLHFSLSDEQNKFLDGAWLELYVLQEAKSTGFFDDVQWGKEIIDSDPMRSTKSPLPFKEMDVALTYGARLMIVECKTGDAGLEAKTLDGIVTVADLVGRGFVAKIVVTNMSAPENTTEQKREGHDNFLTKAKVKGVNVVTQEQLPQIGTILKERAQRKEGWR